MEWLLWGPVRVSTKPRDIKDLKNTIRKAFVEVTFENVTYSIASFQTLLTLVMRNNSSQTEMKSEYKGKMNIYNKILKSYNSLKPNYIKIESILRKLAKLRM